MPKPQTGWRSSEIRMTFGLMGLAVLALTLWLMFPTLKCYRVKQWWSQTKGEILGGELTEVTKPENGLQLTRMKVEMRYEYTVGGRTYVGTRYAPDGDEIEGGSIIFFKQAHHIGDRATIYYHPDDPSRSYFTANTEMTGPEVLLWTGVPILISLVLLTLTIFPPSRGRVAADESPAHGETDARTE